MSSKKKKNRKVGRPTKYDSKFDRLVYKLSLLGATNEEIADALEIDPDTLYRWQKKHPNFYESIKKGKIQADAEIAESLFNRAKGYDYKEFKIESLGADEPEDEEIELLKEYDNEVVDRLKVSKIVTTTRHVPADTAAAFIWLKNRQPQKWRDKKDEHQGDKPPTIIEDARTENYTPPKDVE